MTEDLNKLEIEVDAMLDAIAPSLYVEPSPQATELAKAALRQQLNENWLAAQPAPTPSAENLQRVREAIDRELKKTTSHPRLRTHIWAPLAAAAAIAICVGLINYSRTAPKPPDVDLDIFVQALEKTFQENPFTIAVDMDLDAIEDNINNLAASTNYQNEILDDIGNQIDQLFNQPEWLEDLSTGAIG
ncbi:MAG: hypothetical protein ACYTBZ_02515 [Planctomycetota bacterium]|jgi:hypothetical protein